MKHRVKTYDPNPDGWSKENFRNMRFGLATTLMRDGFYHYQDGGGCASCRHQPLPVGGTLVLLAALLTLLALRRRS